MVACLLPVKPPCQLRQNLSYIKSMWFAPKNVGPVINSFTTALPVLGTNCLGLGLICPQNGSECGS